MQFLGAAANVLHVILDQPIPEGSLRLWQQERFWVAIGSITSLAVAVVTGFMAFFTRALATDTNKLATETRDVVQSAQLEAQQRERHHRESLAPLITTRLLEARVLDLQRDLDGTESYTLRLIGKIENVGPGPASVVTLWFTPSAVVRRKFFAAPIGPSSTIEIDLRYKVGSSFAGAANSGKTWPFGCAIEYGDMFGDSGWLIVSSATGRSDDIVVLENVTVMSEHGDQNVQERLSHFNL
ncbi:MAG: hypothetical protein WB681_07470 [Candidatus Cybelea sp.]